MDEFLTNGHFGYYNEFFIQTVFIHRKEDNLIINFFTTFTAIENRGEFKEEKIKLGKINNKFNAGIVTRFVSKIDFTKEILKILHHQNFSDDGVSIHINKMTLLEKQFVSCGSKHSLVNIVCPTRNSYVFELYDYTKSNLLELLEDELQNYNINLSAIPERFGNILVVFPNGLIKGISRTENPIVNIEWDSRYTKQSLTKCIYVQNSELVSEFSFGDLEDGKTIKFPVKHKSQEVKLISTESNLLLLTLDNCYGLTIQIGVSALLNDPRILKDGSQMTIGKKPGISVQGTPLDKTLLAVKESLRDQEILENEIKLKHKQYGVDSGMSSSNHLEDLRTLISQYGDQGFCIWDPYLSGSDIIELVVNHFDKTSKVRALTSKKAYQSGVYHSDTVSESTKKEIFFTEEKHKILDASNSVGLNIDFRCAHGFKESSLHDRFIIFPSIGVLKEIKAWSLGISINQFGREHHILHEVEIPKYILKAFDQVWRKCNTGEHIICQIDKTT